MMLRCKWFGNFSINEDSQNNSYWAYDRDRDGVLEDLIHDQMLPGTYTVESISLSDDSDQYNNAGYYRDGRLEGDVDSSTHSLDLSGLDFTIENTNTIDTEAPELVSLSIRDNTLEPGDILFIDYVATDASGIGNFNVYFSNEKAFILCI